MSAVVYTATFFPAIESGSPVSEGCTDAADDNWLFASANAADEATRKPLRSIFIIDHFNIVRVGGLSMRLLPAPRISSCLILQIRCWNYLRSTEMFWHTKSRSTSNPSKTNSFAECAAYPAALASRAETVAIDAVLPDFVSQDTFGRVE